MPRKSPAASQAATSDWRHAARCRDEDPEALFVQGAQQRDARELCRACPVRTECLAHALDNRVRFGVWGGMTERERRALLKRRPDVVSWSALLESARREAAARAEPAGDPAGEAVEAVEAGQATGTDAEPEPDTNTEPNTDTAEPPRRHTRPGRQRRAG